MAMGLEQRLVEIEKIISELKKDLAAVTDGVKYTEELTKLKTYAEKIKADISSVESRFKPVEEKFLAEAKAMIEKCRPSVFDRFKAKKDEPKKWRGYWRDIFNSTK